MADKQNLDSVNWINVGYDMRNQIKLFIGERSKVQFDSGCKMFDLHLQDPFNFEIITFQNFYTGYLTIKAREKYSKESHTNEWKILVKRLKLMENVHSESGANQSFVITKDMMLEKSLKQIVQLRFILQQPSFYWKDFGIEEIRLKTPNPELALDKILDEYSKKAEKIKKVNYEKIPPIELLSNRLQNLWMLCNEASKQTKSELEDNSRFEVDGSYEVNMLTMN